MSMPIIFITEFILQKCPKKASKKARNAKQKSFGRKWARFSRAILYSYQSIF